MMWKKAFTKLPEERKQEIMNLASALYVEYPFEEVTIRRITESLGINVATFYRYFDEKEDLAIYIYRNIYSRFVQEDVNIFTDKIPMEKLNEAERSFIIAAKNWPEYMHRRMIFEVSCEFALPLVKASLQKERMRGHLRRNVPDDFAAYMYVTAEYNLYCYCRQREITDSDLIQELSDYMDRCLFMEGIFLPEKSGEE